MKLKLRNAIDKYALSPIEISKAKTKLENFGEYLCVVISIDDEMPTPYYDEDIVYMKYHKEGNVFIDTNDNEWEIDEILFVYLPII